KGIVPDTLTEGGNGFHSLEGEMSGDLPERYEAGTLPMPAIAGLSEGLRVLLRLGVDRIGNYERELYCLARERLGNINGVRLYLPEEEGSILLFTLDGLSPEAVARALNERGICVRSGYHCAALAHRTLGTLETGAVRISLGPTNRPRELDALWRAVEEIWQQKEITRD
ncbi:MAG: aminotransferase class V-fold PLP-dependent enzyme, partial [Clostridia bacterium]|nr:aminotransferase class V-fold PLP-dependent enzyme [Clostridia bacterium]